MSETRELQEKITRIRCEVGWSLAELARVIYYEKYDDDDIDAVMKFEQAFKKQLKRPTTKPDVLHGYLTLMLMQREVQKNNSHQVSPLTLGFIDNEVLQLVQESGRRQLRLIREDANGS